ncbi:hypothetical protein [Flavobacterium litorale]|uniref:Lipoprotein n=1 Tax=Flavobacterium litorale TaxID=2856519 RepID=A0ABX8V9S2_9FLAO|nr:hypothetical protein [Flavobacterium litorale]QYJ69257.1 hypothetical protein K1I41_05035 [Flavobacterium litorale]
MKNFILITLFVTLLLTSCSDTDYETRTVRVKGKYSIDIPKMLSKATDLNEDASLQYQNTFRELYVIVIDESKREYENVIVDSYLEEAYGNNLNGYSKLVVEGIEREIVLDSLPKLKDITINGMKAKTFATTGEVDAVRGYWNITFIEGRNNYYQVMSWTLPDNIEKYEDIINDMRNSFKDTDKSKK